MRSRRAATVVSTNNQPNKEHNGSLVRFIAKRTIFARLDNNVADVFLPCLGHFLFVERDSILRLNRKSTVPSLVAVVEYWRWLSYLTCINKPVSMSRFLCASSMSSHLPQQDKPRVVSSR